MCDLWLICEYDAMSVWWSVRVVCCVWWCEMEAMCDIARTLGKALAPRALRRNSLCRKRGMCSHLSMISSCCFIDLIVHFICN